MARQVIYGRNPVHEALRGRRRVHRVWATQAAAKEDWRPAKVTIASEHEIAERAGSEAHQGVAALVDAYPYADADALLAEKDPLIVALDEVTDPQNLGAIARTAGAAGATGIVILSAARPRSRPRSRRRARAPSSTCGSP